MREKLMIFPYRQCIIRISISLAFRRYSQLPGRWWGLRNLQKFNTHFTI